jgi:hypothetical protein
MFFHSFPHHRENEPADEEKGLRILASILQSGLLLVPEVIEYPPEYPGGQKYRLVQSRFCLTQLDDPERLEHHAAHFGTFHLEFADQTIYSLGAIPVMYLPMRKNRSAAGSIADLGSFFIHRLLEIQNLCARVEKLELILLKNRFKETVTIDDETNESYTVNVKQAKTVLKMLCRDIMSFDQVADSPPFDRIPAFVRIQGAIQGFTSLFYPTDMDRKDYRLLYYFRQREWRIIRGIIPGEQAGDKPIDEALTAEENDTLLKIDPVFYGPGEKELEFIDCKKPRIRGCSVIRALDGRPVWEKIDYIIVPAAKLEAARDLTENKSLRNRIIDMETRKEIRAKTGAEKTDGRT